MQAGQPGSASRRGVGRVAHWSIVTPHAPTPPHLTPAEAAGLLRPRDTLGLGLGPANPDGFLTALGGRDDWEELVVGGALLLGYYPFLAHPGVAYRSGFFGPAERVLLAQGARVELVPGGFRQFGPILRRFAPRVMAVQAAPPDEDPEEGWGVNLSLHMGATIDELLAAGRDPDRLLVVEVSPNFPRTRSLPPTYRNRLPLDVIDVLVESSSTPYELPPSQADDVDRAIAALARSFVRDGSTLQIGIGAVPDMVAHQLAIEETGGSYGIHSEMFTDGLMNLHRAGKITNDAKGIFDGRSVTTFALGSRALYDWLDGNDDIAFLPVEVVNDPTVIARNRSFVSVNGALAVDLYGQIVADCVDGRQISGVGGHEDFVSGAELRADDHSLVCLHSTVTVAGETRSRIVAELPGGSVVSTPRHHTGVVVTEHGAADLVGLTVRERAHALADLAHPDYRAELHHAAEALGRG